MSSKPEKSEGEKIKVGDVVKLKSSGPRMTVVYVGGKGKKVTDEVECGFFSEDAYFTVSLVVGALEIVE